MVPTFGLRCLIKENFMKKINNKKAEVKSKDKAAAITVSLSDAATKPLNDGMNTPVPDKVVPHIRSASEEALYKQAENPLGNPDKK